MAGANTQHFDESNFESEVLSADVPVLVDFWADWCGPCHMVAPVIDELAADYHGQAKVGKCNVDQAPNLAAKFGVQNIPTVLIFQGGQPVHRIVGAKHKKDYQALLDQVLGRKATA